MDQFIRPEHRVTDFLTFVSGITPELIKFAPTFKEIKKKVISLFQLVIILDGGWLV